MSKLAVSWAIGRLTIEPAVRLLAPLRVYGRDRVPREGGLVMALNHFSWLDPPAFGAASPRTIHYMAKMEIHRVPGLGQAIRALGAFAVRRGESDREAVRLMRELLRDGEAVGLFVEGTRQRSGVPGAVKPGASMAALQEEVPVIVGVIHGSQHWRLGTFRPISVAWGEPMRFEGLARNAKGYREASTEIQREIRRLWEFLVDVHELGRPREVVPPARYASGLAGDADASSSDLPQKLPGEGVR
jgi:1-acyl-sn-glycerol-3-phosphate acyltransferase